MRTVELSAGIIVLESVVGPKEDQIMYRQGAPARPDQVRQ